VPPGHRTSAEPDMQVSWRAAAGS